MQADEWRLTLAASISRCSLLVAGLAHPDGTATPASFWHGHPVTGTGVAEPLTA